MNPELSPFRLKFGNLDDDDGADYKGTMDYTVDGQDKVHEFQILEFRYQGPGRNMTEEIAPGSCTRVTDVQLRKW